MNGPRSTGPEYTGKHRRDSGPGVLPPAWRRAESGSRPGAGAAGLPGRRPEPVFRPEVVFRREAGQWPDAG